MASYLGVDWADGCWLVVKAGDEPGVTTAPSMLNVWHDYGRPDDVASILVDIPIGLPPTGPRACDEAAAAALGARGSTVYPIPGRDVVETDDYEEARRRNGGSLGSQSWWLFPRIREVDIFLQEYDAVLEKTYESHPEVCFTAFASTPLPSKDTDEGRHRRLEILGQDDALHAVVTDLVAERTAGAEWHHRISKRRVDDVLDAAVLALTAKSLDLRSRCESMDYPAYPHNAEVKPDPELGIPPEIIHPRPA